jgi:hypothetical protein
MGCKIPKCSDIKVISKTFSEKTLGSPRIKSYKIFSDKDKFQISEKGFKSYNNKITPNLWKKVFDFLPYQDLKEVGKVNRKFNIKCKSYTILLKFFQNKDDYYDYNTSIKKKSFDSLSQLQISNDSN